MYKIPNVNLNFYYNETTCAYIILYAYFSYTTVKPKQI